MDNNLNAVAVKRLAQVGIVCNDAQKAMDAFCMLFQVPENRRALINVKGRRR